MKLFIQDSSNFPSKLPNNPRHGDTYIDPHDINFMWVYNKRYKKYLRIRVSRQNYMYIKEGFLVAHINIVKIVPLVQKIEKIYKILDKIKNIRSLTDIKKIIYKKTKKHKKIKLNRSYLEKVHFDKIPSFIEERGISAIETYGFHRDDLWMKIFVLREEIKRSIKKHIDYFKIKIKNILGLNKNREEVRDEGSSEDTYNGTVERGDDDEIQLLP